MFNLFKKKDIIKSIANGKIIKIEEVPDQVFSSKMMGNGFAILPTGNDFYSPVAGEVVTVFKTLHAYGIKTDNGVEVLVHIGLDTVHLNGEGFEAHVKVGDKISAGQKIATVDLEYVKSQGKPVVTPVVFTDSNSYSTLEVEYKDALAKEDIGKITL
jgi:glucose-specific phosphotransferase system IIA component